MFTIISNFGWALGFCYFFLNPGLFLFLFFFFLLSFLSHCFSNIPFLFFCFFFLIIINFQIWECVRFSNSSGSFFKGPTAFVRLCGGWLLLLSGILICFVFSLPRSSFSCCRWLSGHILAERPRSLDTLWNFFFSSSLFVLFFLLFHIIH